MYEHSCYFWRLKNVSLFIFKLFLELHSEVNMTGDKGETQKLYIVCIVHTLLEKQSKFPRYNMKCRRKPDTTWNIPRSITFTTQHFMLYRGKSITFGTVQEYQLALLSLYTCSCAAMLLVTGDPIHSFFIRYCLLFSVYCMFTYK